MRGGRLSGEPTLQRTTCWRFRDQQVRQSYSIAIQNKRARFGQDNRTNLGGHRRGETYKATGSPGPPHRRPAKSQLSSREFKPACYSLVKRNVARTRGLLVQPE